MRDDLDWAVWSRERQQRIEHVLDAALPLVAGPAATLTEAMRYAVLGGGKRVRPLLAYAAGEFAHGDVAVVDAVAAAVEMIHAYSLIHDDLPCMDDDTLRRGRPTAHVAFGEATALLAGDALQAAAFGMLGASSMRDAGLACAKLARASGVAGMAGGQAIDLAAVGQALPLPDLEAMHRMKTGALIRAAVELGAMCGPQAAPGESAALAAFAGAAGLAFQVVDDVLDVTGTAASLGKTAGKDAAHGKPTYVTLLGLDEAKRRAESLRLEAHAALAPCGARARRLVELADWIVLRQH
jgi:farnesyl diphosphate synthase